MGDDLKVVEKMCWQHSNKTTSLFSYLAFCCCCFGFFLVDESSICVQDWVFLLVLGLSMSHGRTTFG